MKVIYAIDIKNGSVNLRREKMYILDEIECAVESVIMFVEEKVAMLQDPTSWSEENSSGSDEEEEVIEDNQSVSNDRYDAVKLKVKAKKLNSIYKESDQYVQVIRNLKLLVAIIKKCRDETVYRNNIRNRGAELADWQMNLSESDRQNLFYEIDRIGQLLLFMEKNIEGKLQEKDMMVAVKEMKDWEKSVKKLKGYFGVNIL